MSPRRQLLECFHAAIDAVQGEHVVAAALCEQILPEKLGVVALGKAAAAMWSGAEQVLDTRLQAGLILTRAGHGPHAVPPYCTVVEGEHPVPGAGSLRAGEVLLDWLDGLPPDLPLLFLISGGTSALVEVPAPGVSPADLVRANQWLLASGLDIGAMNAVRRRLSAIKGGRLAVWLAGRPVWQWLISDVAGDDPAVIGSGLLAPPRPPPPEAPLDGLPDWLRTLCAPERPPPSASVFAHIDTRILANNAMALDAAARCAATRFPHLPVRRHAERLSGDAVVCGQRLAACLRDGPPGVYLWGGETTVVLPETPGRGGRCQSLALAAAEVLAGHEDLFLLAAGTDGADGPGEDAGALVDGGTLRRGVEEGLDAADCLARADAGRFLEASGDLISTGPTGTNVTDVVLACKIAP